MGLTGPSKTKKVEPVKGPARIPSRRETPGPVPQPQRLPSSPSKQPQR
jgi:hypothetical protein